jgi:hypothetical protein
LDAFGNSGKWGYGTFAIIVGQSGQKMTVQPNRPAEFFAELRKQAPSICPPGARAKMNTLFIDRP